MRNLTKAEVEEEIKKIGNSELSQEQIKKIKKLAMHYTIKLGILRKKFCGKCYSPRLKVKSIKRGIKTSECENCGNVVRWKIR